MDVPTMDDTIPLELEKALVKAEKINQRNIDKAGYAASDLGSYVTKNYLGHLCQHIDLELQQQEQNTQEEIALVLGGLSTEVLALCAITKVIHGIAIGQKMVELYVSAGLEVQAECWAAGLIQKNPKLFDSIDKKVRERHSSVEYRRTAARALARRKDYIVDRWPKARVVRAGAWLVNCVFAALPEVFEWVREAEGWYSPTLCAGALEAAEKACGEAIDRNPVFLPRREIPNPWTAWTQTHVDPRINGRVTFLRTIYGDVIAAAKAAIADGSMKPAMDAVTALQSVPWRINKRIYGVIRGCMEQGIEVDGLPTAMQIVEPERTKAWGDMSELEQTQWKIIRDESEKQNRAMRGERLSLIEDMSTAEHLLDAERFYTAMNCDWRGRVYSVPHFNFAREDRVRAMFEFANGEPIGHDGLRWLQMHVANCGDFEKISKQPIEDRVQWTINNTERLAAMVEVPMKDLWWTKADKPFLFLAACLELVSALSVGSTFVTRLPVSFDGSCSGLQHLSAMTRDETTAALVNLTPGDRPNDVYAVIADGVRESVLEDRLNELSQKFLDLGIDRKMAKRNVMTYSYSSKKYGMASQQQVDLLDELYKDVILGKREDHPFGQNRKMGAARPTKAARYIASHIFDTIEARIHRPAQAMKFLQSIAKALAHEGKPVIWKTPTGIPWVNRYHEPIMQRLRLWMWDKGVKVETRVVIADGLMKGIDKDKAANGVAPNFVHANDAAHLQLTVNAAVAAGINNIATVHDSFGCLANRAGEFNNIIRQQFTLMYETHDVLSEVLERAKCDLTQHSWDRLPSVPQSGNLNLKEIENATYAFA